MSTPEEFATQLAGYNQGDMAWLASATVFCWGIIPAVGFLYSGYTNRKNGAATVWASLIVMSVGSISWMTLGYSLTYGTGNAFIGDASKFGHKGVMGAAVFAIPELEYSIFQLVFSVATIAIFVGGAAERARLACIPIIVFIWPLVVYSPVAHWTWSSNGWLATLGAYDFAGGSPVHIASGAGSMAFSVYLSHPLFRSKKSASRSLQHSVAHRPHNLLHLVLAYIFIAGGWLAFDGGSTLALNLRSFVAMINTQFSGCVGGFTWVLLDFMYTGKWSIAAFVCGSIAGLVAITPGCGYVSLPASLLFGFLGAVVCFYACQFKHTRFAQRIKWSDPVDVFASHCIGGIVGNLLTAIFAQKSIAATDGATTIAGGWLDGNFVQLGIQLADCVSVTAYAFVVTYILVALVDCIPGLEVLATDDEIIMGIDQADMGESFGSEQWQDEADYHPFLGSQEKDARTISMGSESESKGNSQKDLSRGTVMMAV